ncbi:MAG: hypothetical protein M5U34_12405 [Chloroflexi bacterium]|nr:hypothetical protein [Chloroflexota bacterium]
MLDDIQDTLADFAQRDSRLHYCLLDVEHLGNERCTLSGVILDAAALAEVVADLQARFPTLSFDARQVKVLSAAEPKKLTVATNVTAVMSDPSWRSEQMSQVMNGWQVEIFVGTGDPGLLCARPATMAIWAGFTGVIWQMKRRP